ncbi:MAG: large conductance mechanosensitive channel protein MscL [Candidatus Limnocylindria bacterium]
MLREFRDFILRGNVIDLAVGIVIGAAFGAMVTSFVTNVLTPLLGLLRIPNFATLAFYIDGANPVPYGLFLNSLISFVLIAAAIFFFVVKPVNAMTTRLKKPESEPEKPIKECPFCATEIPTAAKRCPNCTSELS